MPENPKNILTLTLRLHDPDEKQNADLSTSWAVVSVPREDLKLSQADFIAKYIVPALGELKQIAVAAESKLP
jgi:hypothetical protein